MAQFYFYLLIFSKSVIAQDCKLIHVTCVVCRPTVRLNKKQHTHDEASTRGRHPEPVASFCGTHREAKIELKSENKQRFVEHKNNKKVPVP